MEQEKFKKFVGSWEFEMQSDNVEEVLAAQGSAGIYEPLGPYWSHDRLIQVLND